MNGSTGNKASGASESPDRGEVFLSLSMAQRMVPLVQRIVEDVLHNQQVLERLHPEQEKLDRQRRHLDWPQRQKRYQLREEVSQAEHALQESLDEMQSLGVALLDPDIGRVGFPTLVNDRRAYFSWRPGEEGLNSWHFAGENVCRPIPNSWLREIAVAAKR
jgi:hypothetical protein